MDTTTTSKNTFVLNTNCGFTVIPNEIWDLVIGSNLPPAGKLLILLVYRFSMGYKNQAVIIETNELVKLLPINHSRIPRLISWMVELHILNGGASQKRANGNILTYELSVNLNFSEWDISYRSTNKTVIYTLHKRAIAVR